jgi:SsrA-binding protein
MEKKKLSGEGRYKEIRNAKVYHDFFVEEKFKAGIVLKGTEVKSIRLGKAQIADAFVKFSGQDVVLFNAHIDEYAFGNIANHSPLRTRKLLLKKREIDQLKRAIDVEGRSVIPLRMFIDSGLVKLEIGVCKGKKLFDKRETLKAKTAKRESEVAMKQAWR